MATTKKGQGGSKKTQKKSSAASTKASKSLEKEVKDFFVDQEKAYQAAKKRRKAAQTGAKRRGVEEEGELGGAYKFKTLADFTDARLDPDYTLVDPTGNVVAKPEVIMDVRKNVTFDEYKRSNHDVRIYGNTALSISQVKMEGDYKGNDITGVYRETNLLVKRRGNWFVLHTHMALIQPPNRLFKKGSR